MKLWLRRMTIATTCAVFIMGCGGGDSSPQKLVKVTGTVTLDGKPLAQGILSFVTSEQGMSNAAGEINRSGAYSLSTHQRGDGVPPGKYQVRIESWISPPTMNEKGVVPGKSAVPPKYSNITTSGLSVTVDGSSRSQVIDFPLMP